MTTAARATARRETRKRVDPETRGPRGVEFGGLVNANPEKHYVRVPTVGRFNTEYYSWLGYDVERFVPEGGVKLAGFRSAQPGEPLSYMGTVLMSIDRSEHERIVSEGMDGRTGQKLADVRESSILNKSRAGASDPMRGIYSQIGVELKSNNKIEERVGDIEEFGDDGLGA